jgi:agmatine deiminase
VSALTLSMPPEWAPHERTVICGPVRDDLWGSHRAEAEAAHAALARTISGYESVTMIAQPEAVARARAACGDAVEVIGIPIDDSWFRDTGPVYVVGDGRRVGTAWRFNAWGGKFHPYDDDARVACAWLDHARHEARTVDMVLEGGSVHVDGAGTIVTTEQCLLHPNRNPDLDRAAIERRLLAELGQSRVVWLPHGLALDDGTDGHVDNVASPLAPGVLAMQGCDDPAEPDHGRMRANAEVARRAGLEVREVPVLPFSTHGGRRAPVPYLNFYFVNGAVIVPTCGHPADADMLALIGEWVPGRDVVGLDVGAILAYGGGGIHCITQQVPAA